MRIRPVCPEIRVKDPVSLRIIPQQGMNVPNTTFWRRRLRDGDIEVIPLLAEEEIDTKKVTQKKSKK